MEALTLGCTSGLINSLVSVLFMGGILYYKVSLLVNLGNFEIKHVP